MPDIEDVLPHFAEANVFSLFDAKDGYLHVKLSKKIESSHNILDSVRDTQMETNATWYLNHNRIV